MIEAGALTDGLLARLADDAGALWGVGDAEAPPDRGWTDLQAGKGTFSPYIVVTAGQGQPLAQQGAMSTLDETEWELAYQVQHFGGSREQVDWVGKGVRNTLAHLVGLVFGDVAPYKVRSVRMPILGAMARIDSVDPAFWTMADTIVLLCTATS